MPESQMISIWLQIIIAVVSIVTVAAGVIVAYLSNSRNAIKRYDELNQKYDAKVQELNDRLFSLQKGHFEQQQENLKSISDCHKERAELQIQVLQLKEEVGMGLRRISHLEKQTGVKPEGVELRQGLIITDLSGMIRELSPEMVDLFKWYRVEMLNKPITFLLADDAAGELMKSYIGFAKDTASRMSQSTPILTLGKDKLQQRIPLAITMTGWQEERLGLITLSVKERPGTDTGQFQIVTKPT